MSVRWRWGEKGKPTGSGEGKVVTRWVQGGGAVTVTRGHGAETHGNNEDVTSVCALNIDGVVSCVTVCSMNFSVDNITMLQRHLISFGNVLIRALVEDNRCGYNVSFVEAQKNVEIGILNDSPHRGKYYALVENSRSDYSVNSVSTITRYKSIVSNESIGWNISLLCGNYYVEPMS
jgi:hypothetical protein